MEQKRKVYPKVPTAKEYVTTTAVGRRAYKVYLDRSDDVGDNYPEILPQPDPPKGYKLFSTNVISYGNHSFQIFWTWVKEI